MRKAIIMFLVTSFFIGCSKEDSQETPQETPETLLVKYEIIGYGAVPQVMYSTNEGTVEQEHDEGEPEWDVSGVTLPFVKEIQYTTQIDGAEGPDGNKRNGCDQLYISAYADRSDGVIEKMNIYINGELKDQVTEGYYYVPGDHWTPWESAEYRYLRRGADPDEWNCSN